jgi:hypothetical protein
VSIGARVFTGASDDPGAVLVVGAGCSADTAPATASASPTRGDREASGSPQPPAGESMRFIVADEQKSGGPDVAAVRRSSGRIRASVMRFGFFHPEINLSSCEMLRPLRGHKNRLFAATGVREGPGFTTTEIG